ncbi:hypothetical protein LAZ67_8001573 [Cordylochernes scorpioides]|uniref:Endonuclease n=1 Tax=Cordylochernes scorpioides TaxID=51811 RepID=A0ABY6KQU7_9ARAC|nr:hypothetical protein LAZ67_8001573 [Cordylochernes scorpioides]
MAEEIILRLKKKRAVNRSYLTKTCNKIESGLDTLMRIELEELLEQLNESFNELKLVDHEIETLLETDDLEKELQGVEEYREKYITWRFRANKKIRQSDFHGENIPNSNSRIDENEMRHYVPSCTTVKLPKLMISKFYGNFSEWLTFWNSFDAAIHQNNSLNPIDKFNYLKSHLGGTALNTVEGFALSADNYEKAIKLLKDRFGREDILISRHMNNLLSMRPLKTSSDVRTFRELFDNLSVHIRSLESLNVSIDVYGQLLCPIIIKLLPADLNLELNKELPTGYVINDLITFLERQLTAREKSFRNEIGTGNESTSKPNLVNKHPKTRFYNEKPIATASELLNSVHKSNECVFCGKDNHGSPKCDFAANISLNEKRSLMKKKGVCYKCLRPSHLSKFCRNVVRCSICNMSSHLDVMCTKLILDRGGSSKSPTVQDETLANLSTSPDVLLPTLRVTLKGNRTEKTARAIIDTGSQRSYILHSTAMEMEYEQSRREFFRHSLFGGSSTDVVEHEVYTIHLSDINNSYRCEFEALGQPLICGSIPPVCPRSFLEGSEELDVSDLMRDRIEVLIGADIAGRLLTDDQRRISTGLVAIRTKLGWTVMGKIPPTEVRDDISSLCVTTLLSLDLENLWKLDAIGVSDAEVEKKTQSLQAEMEEHFAHTTTRDIEGRYEVALPWVQDKERIPSNKDLAENQLRSVRRKLEEVGDMKEYGQIFEEWMKQGIIEYAREDKLDGVHYLPHRPVYKRNSQTSRIRPVFNASARKRGKLSLNDCLDKGPNLIEIIPRLLNKFRKYEVGVSSDIEKAFLQIGIKEEDRDYLRFLWHTEDGRLITYRHKRVVFGITTSPYLLKATLSLHLDKTPEHLKITAEQLKSSFYVDNCLSSFQNVEETEKFVKESTELLSTACFNLRDWVSNVTDFSLMNQLNKEVNILGITWNTDRDTLTIGLEDFELIGPTTKRKVLSIASKIFDPLGVACPVTLIPKLILQETWIQKLTWDEVLPGCLVQRFWKWFSKLKHLPNIEIPRWLCFKDSYVEKTTLHIFCDASQFAYATCIFLRIEKEDRVDIQLIQARTRVAPLKKLTIPRLELLACLIGARLAANVIQDLEFEEIPRFYWTDSTNALCWIQREDNWAAFVMNRVKEIHNLSSPESWRHIPGRLNPADLPSRGCSAESLKETRWWEGPAWLKVSQEEWPKSTIIPDLEIVYSERRKTILNTLCTTRENENLFGRYSHFLRIVRITAWIYRFFNNAKIDRRKIISDLSTEEITKSEIILIRLIQRESFSGHEDKKLQGFKLLVDSSGILRIKTKICRREDFANFRMPILLPSDHFLVSLLIRWNHETHGHAGLQTLLGILRENYWILRSRKTVKKIINQCIRCKRFTVTPATVESTSLPEDRVRDAAVFEIVGVDLTGHLILKNKKKAWIVIFTCAVYRGVHLELVTSLSMEAFLQAFRRFIARRGRPLIVYSDNGTNFKGMANALKKIDFSRLKCDPTLKNITWKFITPGAPWWGGWWERLIGMMKQLLFRILGQTSLGYEELSTVMCDVESLMNTRPLTYLTEESEDLAPLTPSLFLHEVREVGVPDLDLIDNQTLSRKYQYIKRVREDLRERFRIEYFGFLRQETRRLKTTIPFKVGDMVLIGQESLKRLHWPLARIIQLYPGKDGLVRVAKVKTSSGDKIRPIQKLYNLEITPEIRCRDPLTERSPTQEVRLTTEEDPLTSQQEQHHIDTPNVVSSYGRPIKRPNRLDLLNFSFPCLSRRDANSKVGEMLEKKTSEAANGKPAEAATGMQRVINNDALTLNLQPPPTKNRGASTTKGNDNPREKELATNGKKLTTNEATRHTLATVILELTAALQGARSPQLEAVFRSATLGTTAARTAAVNAYKEFIPDHARLRTPLINLLKKDIMWVWDDECQKAFTNLKENLTTHPTLHLYQEGLPCQVYCNTSTFSITGVLKQIYPDGKTYTVQHFSRSLRNHERNYSDLELQCLAIVESVDNFRTCLMDRKFTIFSDHPALQWLKEIKAPSGRLFRWRLRLSRYEYEVRSINGVQQYETGVVTRIPFCGFLDAPLIKSQQSSPPGKSRVTMDPYKLRTVSRKGVLKTIVPNSFTTRLLKSVHTQHHHPNISKMTRLISAQYYWQNMTQDIAKQVKTCPTCRFARGIDEYKQPARKNTDTGINCEIRAKKSPIKFGPRFAFDYPAKSALLASRVPPDAETCLLIIYMFRQYKSWTPIISIMININCNDRVRDRKITDYSGRIKRPRSNSQFSSVPHQRHPLPVVYRDQLIDHVKQFDPRLPQLIARVDEVLQESTRTPTHYNRESTEPQHNITSGRIKRPRSNSQFSSVPHQRHPLPVVYRDQLIDHVKQFDPRLPQLIARVDEVLQESTRTPTHYNRESTEPQHNITANLKNGRTNYFDQVRPGRTCIIRYQVNIEQIKNILRENIRMTERFLLGSSVKGVRSFLGARRPAIIYTPRLHLPGPQSPQWSWLTGFHLITLPSTDYRVLAAILLRRLRPHLPTLAFDCQTYAIPGRSPSWNIARVTDEVEIATAGRLPLAVVSVDLMSLLVSLGLLPAFIRLIQLLYAGVNAAVRIGEPHTAAFPLLNGVRQGFAVSAALFCLATTPLLRRLQSALGEGNVIAYADDIVLMFRQEEHFSEVASIFQGFQRASGIRVNFRKSVGL